MSEPLHAFNSRSDLNAVIAQRKGDPLIEHVVVCLREEAFGIQDRMKLADHQGLFTFTIMAVDGADDSVAFIRRENS